MKKKERNKYEYLNESDDPTTKPKCLRTAVEAAKTGRKEIVLVVACVCMCIVYEHFISTYISRPHIYCARAKAAIRQYPRQACTQHTSTE